MNGHDNPSLFEPQTDEEWNEWWGENQEPQPPLPEEDEEGQFWNAGEIAAMEMGD